MTSIDNPDGIIFAFLLIELEAFMHDPLIIAPLTPTEKKLCILIDMKQLALALQSALENRNWRAAALLCDDLELEILNYEHLLKKDLT